MASTITAGRHVNVVDAQGWGFSEEFVPEEERIELLSTLSLCGHGGPHVVLIVIPLLDFLESEGRAVEKRMEILTSTVWRHTMVLFTCGDLLRRRGRTVEEHIRSGGPALHRLMEKCGYRYHVFNNKAALGKQERREQEVKSGGNKGTWQKRTVKGVGRKSTGGETDGTKEEGRQQVIELLHKVEDMLEENRGWHFSLHMYQRLEEEWSQREQELRTRLERETDMRSVRERQRTAKINMEPAQEQGLAGDEKVDKVRRQKKKENKDRCVKMEMKRWENKEKEMVGLSSDSEGESTLDNSGLIAPCQPNWGQRLSFSPVRGLA